MNKKDYPRFISSKPAGVDKFEGKSQEKIANIIISIIKENKLEKKIIGLDGEWGAGKSNVIEIIKNKIGKDYFTYVFDAWGNQEDLTRRTFLEELIDSLFLNGFLNDSQKWKDKKDRLLANKTTAIKQIFPKVKPFWIFITTGVFLFFILSGLFQTIWINYNFSSNWNAGLWKPLISIYLLPSFFIGIGIGLAIKQYLLQREENNSKSDSDKESKLQTLGRIFYWLKGESIESEERENIIVNEPTIKQFREYFDLIQKDLGNKGLLIVFDNIDRLDKEKVKALWSSIHTFFAENGNEISYEKTWVIIPYYRKKLAEIFDRDDSRDNNKGFIEKTFAVTYRVSPPIVRAWDKFLKDSLQEAFGKDIIPSKEINHIVNIFDVLVTGNTIKPREIINFVNQLVTLYNQWIDEVKNKQIKFRYLALFVLVKDFIVDNPVDNILEREYLKGSKSLFNRDKDLDTIISALTFNVKIELADEVLLKRELSIAIRNGMTELIEKSKDHIAFIKYFTEAYEKVDFESKRLHLTILIQSVTDILPKETITNYWEDFADNLLSIDDQYEKFNEDHKAIIKNVSTDTSILQIKKLLDSQSKDLSDEKSQDKYYNFLIELRNFLTENDIFIDFEKYLPETKFTPSNFINVVVNEESEYKKFNISCTEKELIDFFFEENVLAIEQVWESLDALKAIKLEFNFKKITNGVIERLANIAYTDNIEFKQCIEILKGLSSKPLTVKLSNTFYSTLNASTIDKDIFIDSVAIALSDFENAIPYGPFQTTLNALSEDDINRISAIVEWYINYGALIFLLVKNSNAIPYNAIKSIVNKLTTNSYGKSKLNLAKVLTEFSQICELVFDDEDEKIQSFLSRIDTWNPSYNPSQFLELDDALFDYLNRQDLELIQRITKDSIEYINNLSHDQCIEALESQDRSYIIIKALVINDLISGFNDHVYTAFDEYINKILEGEENIPEDSFIKQKFIQFLDGRKLKGIFTRIRDRLLTDPRQTNYEIIKFLIDDLIKHGNLGGKPGLVTYQLVDYLFQSQDSINSIFSVHLDFFINAIKESGEFIDDAKTKIRSNLDLINENNIKERLINELKLKVSGGEDEG